MKNQASRSRSLCCELRTTISKYVFTFIMPQGTDLAAIQIAQIVEFSSTTQVAVEIPSKPKTQMAEGWAIDILVYSRGKLGSV